MKLLKVILVFLFVSSGLYAKSNYCIQVAAIYKFNEKNIPEKISNILNNFNKARIDKRAGKLVLRVGDYREFRDAQIDLEKIHNTHYDAYIRKCDYDPSRVVYEKNTYRDVGMRDGYQMQSGYGRDSRDYSLRDEYFSRDRRKKAEEDEYQIDYGSVNNSRTNYRRGDSSARVEYKGQDRGNYDLYRECQKCFAPMNLEYNGQSTQENNNYIRRTSRNLYEEDDDGFNDYEEERSESYGRESREPKRVNKETQEKEESGFFDFLKKPQYRTQKKVEESDRKAGFFNYLKTNKYEEKEKSRYKAPRKETKSEDGFFDYFKSDTKKDNYEDEYDNELNGDNVYDMYGIEKQRKIQTQTRIRSRNTRKESSSYGQDTRYQDGNTRQYEKNSRYRESNGRYHDSNSEYNKRDKQREREDERYKNEDSQSSRYDNY